MLGPVNYIVPLGQIFIVILTLLGIVAYAFFLIIYIALKFLDKDNAVTRFFEASPPIYMFGLPIAATIAFAIVSILFSLSPPTVGCQQTDPLTFAAFDMKFSGPAGPVTIWIVVYLSIIGSIKMVRDMADRHEDKKKKQEGKTKAGTATGQSSQSAQPAIASNGQESDRT